MGAGSRRGLKRAAAAVAVVAAALIALAATGTSEPPRLRLVSAPVPSPLLGIVTAPYGAKLLRLDPRTLRPAPGPRLEVGNHVSGWSFSDDRSRLALGDGQGRLLVVDPRDLRRGVEFDPGGPAGLVASAWTGDRLLTVSRSFTGVIARTIDWPHRRIVGKSELRGNVQAVARSGGSVVLVLAPLRGFAPARLAVIGPDSSTRVVTLDRIRVGSAEIEESRGPLQVLRHARAGVAVSPSGTAYVVAADAPIAEVGLSRLDVSYHRPRARSSLAARLGDWLQPAAQAKGAPDGPNRTALWLGGHTIAVLGTDDHGSLDARGRPRYHVTSAGVTLVDTRSWTRTTLSADATRVAVADSALLLYGSVWDSARQRESGVGLTAIGPDRRLLFHVLGNRAIWDVQVAGGRALLGIPTWKYHSATLDLASGRVSFGRAWPVRLLLGEALPG